METQQEQDNEYDDCIKCGDVDCYVKDNCEDACDEKLSSSYVAIRILWAGARAIERKLEKSKHNCIVQWSGYGASSTEWWIGVTTSASASEIQDFIFELRPMGWCYTEDVLKENEEAFLDGEYEFEGGY